MVDRPVPAMSDDELLAALSRAMAPEHVEPSPTAVADVRLLLTARTSGGRHPLRARLADLRWRLTGWRARLAVAGATVGVVVVAGGTAFALGAPVPAPVRALAYDLGLPVTAPAVVQVQNAAHAVQSDLVPSSGVNQATRVRDTRTLAHALAGLNPNERLSVGSSWRIFAQACRDISATSGTPTPAAPPTPVPGCTQSSAVSPTPAGRAGGNPAGGHEPASGGRTTPPGRPGGPPSGSNPPGHGGSGGDGGGAGGHGAEGPPGGSALGMAR